MEKQISLESRDFPTPYLILNGLYNRKTVRKLKGELAEVHKIIAEKEEEIQRLEKSRKRQRQSEDYSGFGMEAEEKELEKKNEEIIPGECWGLVFQNLNADDLMTCRLVCKTFRRILDLKQFKLKWKFQLVLPILFEHLEEWNDQGRRTWKNFHNLRLVCQSWRQSVDKYLSDIHEPPSFSMIFPLTTSLLYEKDIVDFHQTFEECKGNPFPAKTVRLSNGRGSLEELFEEEDEDEDKVNKFQNAYMQKVTDFMERFGRHIHKLELNFSRSFYGKDYLFMCKIIKDITPHLPNLHTFRIYDNVVRHDGQIECRVRDDPQQTSTWIEGNALSDLPKLHSLQIEGLNEIAENYLLEKYASQLPYFERTYDYKGIVHQPQFQLFQNLSILKLVFADDAGTLEPLRFLQSPLKLIKFVLCCENDGAEITWNMDKALRDLRHLPIQSLEVEAYANVNFVECLPPDEYFNESIQTLTFHITYFENSEDENYVGQISFNFLQALTKLENLDLKFELLAGGTITHPEGLPEVVKLNKYMIAKEETLYHSNVWEKVPSLKTLKAERESEDGYFKSTYTRKEYERLMINAE